MNKGFLATTILLSCISILYSSTIIHNTLNQKMRNTQNYVRMNQRTQDNKYRINQGFKDTVKQSMKNTGEMNHIKRETLACKALEKWINQLKSKEHMDIEVKAGYIDPVTYQYSEKTNLAFQSISSVLKKDPSKAIGELKSHATNCIDYLSIHHEKSKATVKHNSYTPLKQIITGYKPSFIIKIDSNHLEQKIIIPSETVIKSKDK